MYENLLLATCLSASGLDPDYWNNVFRGKLKISRLNEVTFESETTFNSVKDSARDEWETTMLRDFLRLKRQESSIKGGRSALAREVLKTRKMAYLKMIKEQHEKTLVSQALTIKGFLFCSNLDDTLTPRQTVLQPKGKTELKTGRCKVSSAIMPSMEQEDILSKTLKTIGSSAAEKLVKTGWGCGGEKGDGSKPIHIGKTQNVQVSTVRTGYCVVNKETVKLSEAAIADLRKLGLEISKSESGASVASGCKDFLRKFGSHVNTVVEFGGICQNEIPDLQSVVPSEEPDPSAEVKGILGGKSGKLVFSSWKENVCQNSNTWTIVDRGVPFSEDFKGIWELLSDYENQIPNAGRLSYELRETWKHTFYPQSISESELRLNNLLQELETLEHETMSQHCALEHVLKMYSSVVQLYITQGSCSYFTDVLMYRDEFQVFLSHIHSLSFRDRADLYYLRCLVGELIEMSGEPDIYEKANIPRWVLEIQEKHVLPPLLQGDKIDSVPSLLKVLQDKIKPSIEKRYSEVPYNDTYKVDIQVTKDIALIFEYLHSHLSKCGDYHQLSFLVSSFSLLMAADNSSSVSVVNLDAIESTVAWIEKNWPQYVRYQEVSQEVLESFLIDLCLSTSPHNETVSLQKAWDPLAVKVDNALKEIIVSSPFKWQRLLSNFLKRESDGTGPFPHEACNPGTDGKISEILSYLELESFYPGKMTLCDVLSHVTDDFTGNSPRDVAWAFLKDLITLNSQARDNLTNALSILHDSGGIANDNDDIFGGFDTNEKQHSPLDIFLAIFLCCDLLLRQTLVRNMDMCNLAFPLIQSDTDGSLTFNLWALRAINTHMNGSIVFNPQCIVSFMRLGRPKWSKSELLNGIQNQNQRNAHFNKECRQGNLERSIAGGLVEASFNKAKGTSKDELEDATLFLNLRGDGMDHMKQVEALTKLSQAIVVCVDISDLKKAEVEEKVMAMSQDTKLILLLLDKEIDCRNTLAEIRDSWANFNKKLSPEQSENIRMLPGFKGKNPKSMIDLQKEITQKIAEAVKGFEKRLLADASHLMTGSNLGIDEKQKQCQQGKDLVKGFIDSVSGNLEPVKGDGGFSATLGEPTAESTCPTDNDRGACSKQVERFLVGLSKAYESKCVLFFLQWVVYGAETEQIPKEGPGPVIQSLLFESALVYERLANPNIQSDIKKHVDQLPDILAHLLLMGYPIQIVNGDTNQMPAALVKAVFERLEVDLGRQSLSTLSVLGCSAGDNITVSDAVFGQVPLMCTDKQSVSLRLVKASTSNQFDYTIVLEAVGVSTNTRTFALTVGFSDVLVLNLQDDQERKNHVLEFAIRTMLMMKKWNDRFKRTQTPIYVFENLGNNGESSVQLRSNIRDIIKERDMLGTKAMDDILKFASEPHVCHFPLWAQNGTAYYEKVHELRKLLQSVEQSKLSWGFADLSHFLNDLWTVTASGNFDTGFESTLAARALSVVQGHFSELQCALASRRHVSLAHGHDVESLCSIIHGDNSANELFENLCQLQAFSFEHKYQPLIERYLSKIDESIRKEDEKRLAEEEVNSKLKEVLTRGSEDRERAKTFRETEKQRHKLQLDRKKTASRKKQQSASDRDGECDVPAVDDSFQRSNIISRPESLPQSKSTNHTQDPSSRETTTQSTSSQQGRLPQSKPEGSETLSQTQVDTPQQQSASDRDGECDVPAVDDSFQRSNIVPRPESLPQSKSTNHTQDPPSHETTTQSISSQQGHLPQSKSEGLETLSQTRVDTPQSAGLPENKTTQHTQDPSSRETTTQSTRSQQGHLPQSTLEGSETLSQTRVDTPQSTDTRDEGSTLRKSAVTKRDDIDATRKDDQSHVSVPRKASSPERTEMTTTDRSQQTGSTHICRRYEASREPRPCKQPAGSKTSGKPSWK